MYRDTWKKIKDGLAREEEASLRSAANRDRAFAKIGLGSSKVSNPGRRADPDVDQQLLKKISRFLRFGSEVALTSRKGSAVRKGSTSLTSKKRKKKERTLTFRKRVIRDANKRIQLVGPWLAAGSRYRVRFPVWDHTSPLVKAMCYGMSIPEGRRFTFSLKLSEEVIGQALKAKKGFAGFMQDRIARFLRNALPTGHPTINFVFVVETWHKWELPHVQGVIDLTEDLPLGDHGFEIQNALQGAGGVFVGRSKGRQVHTRLVYDAAGWFEYLGKRRMVTAKTLNQMRRKAGLPSRTVKESLLGATEALQQAGKRWFEDAKASEEFVLRDRRIN